mgnify:CR=1 FL=1
MSQQDPLDSAAQRREVVIATLAAAVHRWHRERIRAGVRASRASDVPLPGSTLWRTYKGKAYIVGIDHGFSFPISTSKGDCLIMQIESIRPCLTESIPMFPAPVESGDQQPPGISDEELLRQVC